MGQLYNRCTKFYLSIGGVETEIAEPINWSSITIFLKRDPKFYGVNFEFSDGEVLLQFDCQAGKDALDTLYNADGNDSEAFLLFDELPDGITRTNLFTGKLDFNTYSCSEFTSSLAVKRVFFGDLLRSRLDIKTTLSDMTSVDGLAVQNTGFDNIELHSKVIQKQSELYQQNDETFSVAFGSEVMHITIGGGGGTELGSGIFYLQWGFDDLVRNDLENIYLLPIGNSLALPDAWVYDALESGLHNINIALKGKVRFFGSRSASATTNNLACGGDGAWNEAIITTMLRHTTDLDVVITDYTIRQDTWTNSNPACHNDLQWVIDYDETLTNSFTINEGEKLYLITKVDVSGDYRQPAVGPRVFDYKLDLIPFYKTSFFDITADTQVPASDAKLLFIHEAITKLVANVSNVNGAVKSDFFGRTDYFDRTYASDGCGGLMSVANGLTIRGFSPDDKPTAISLADLLDDLQAIYNIGVQFSTETKTKQVEVWQRRYNTLNELESAQEYEAITNIAYTYTVLLQADPTADVRAYSADAEIYIDGVLTYTLSVDEVTTSDSQAFTGAGVVKVVITNVVDGQNTDFARLQIVELQTSQESDLLIVEHFDSFFIDTEILEIDSFENYTEQVANDYIFNSVSIGYASWENEKINGLDEFATQQQNILPINTARVDKQAISNIVASGYAIEFTRRLLQGTEDSTYDNDIFSIQLQRDGGTGFETETDDPFDVVDNLIDPPTAYNLRLSPKRNLMNWASFLSGCLFYKPNTDTIKFASGEGNFSLSTQFKVTEPCLSGDINRIVLDEDGDIELTNFNGKISPIQPTIIKFRAILSFDTLLILKDAPFGYISILGTHKGDVEGYILDLQYSPDVSAGWTDFTLIKKQ